MDADLLHVTAVAAVHSLADTSNELLLIYGRYRARRPPDTAHPFGYGREVYFWSFMVSVLLFALGAGVSIWTGVRHVLHPHPFEQPIVSYVVLGLAALFEGGSWWFAFREFRRRMAGRGMLETAREAKEPSTVMVFLALTLIGLIATKLLPLEQFPDITFPGMQVTIPYAGSTPEEIEELITRPVEEALSMSGGDLAAPLGALPPMKIHCAQLVEGALRNALAPDSTAPAPLESPKPATTLFDQLSSGQNAGKQVKVVLKKTDD